MGGRADKSRPILVPRQPKQTAGLWIFVYRSPRRSGDFEEVLRLLFHYTHKLYLGLTTPFFMPLLLVSFLLSHRLFIVALSTTWRHNTGPLQSTTKNTKSYWSGVSRVARFEYTGIDTTFRIAFRLPKNQPPWWTLFGKPVPTNGCKSSPIPNPHQDTSSTTSSLTE